MTNTTKDMSLPKQFSVLESQIHFALPTTHERLVARVSRTMPELQAFYDTLAPHMEAIMEYLKGFPPVEKELDPQTLRLMHLVKSFMNIAVGIELLKAPDEPNVWPYDRIMVEDF